MLTSRPRPRLRWLPTRRRPTSATIVLQGTNIAIIRNALRVAPGDLRNIDAPPNHGGAKKQRLKEKQLQLSGVNLSAAGGLQKPVQELEDEFLIFAGEPTDLLQSAGQLRRRSWPAARFF